MDSKIIDDAIEGRFSDFSAGVTSALKEKLANHPSAVEYSEKIDNIGSMKQQFVAIAQSATDYEAGE